MANAVRGEQAAGFGDRLLTLSFSVDAICQIEDRLGQKVREIGDRILGDETTSFRRALIWAGLRDHHPEITEKAAGELMLEDGSEVLWPALIRAWGFAWPMRFPEAANAPSDPPQPPGTAAARKRTKAGTGPRSSRSGASSSSGRRKATGGKPHGRSTSPSKAR